MSTCVTFITLQIYRYLCKDRNRKSLGKYEEKNDKNEVPFSSNHFCIDIKIVLYTLLYVVKKLQRMAGNFLYIWLDKKRTK